MTNSGTILVVNSGSSSLKFTLYSNNVAADVSSAGVAQQRRYTRLANGTVERIGLAGTNFIYKRGDEAKTEEIIQAADHGEALAFATKILTDPARGVIPSLDSIDAIGHRVVHGGEIFKSSVVVDPVVIGALKSLIPLAPLHNPPNIGGIEACERLFKGKPNVAVFDTAFHQTMPDHASHYAIPRELYEKHGIRKYGFHGTSHRFVMLAAAEYLGKKPEDINLITCHLGNGSSIAAIKNGAVVDTSMGMTPLDGLVMGSRCGCIDPAVVLMLMREGKTADEIDALLNKKSGLTGVGGINSGDMRDITGAAASGTASAQLAYEMWVHRILLYIGGYAAVLGNVDAIVFTGGIGENHRAARHKLVSQFGFFGATLDENANAAKNGPCHISTPESKTAVIVIPTDEELMIAQETLAAVKNHAQ